MEDIMHHARLKNILEKLIVVNGPARLDFKHPAHTACMSISIEALQYFSFSTKKHWDNDFVIGGLSFLNPKSELFQSWSEPRHNLVAVLAQSFS
jgi:hypothetical protein